MRLTDLLDADVLDPEGGAIGRVHDVRLVQDGPPLGNAGATFRVDGMVVGGTGLGARLGFARSDVRAPWLLNLLLQRLRADERYVPWSAVRAISEGRLLVDVRADDLAPPEPLA
jgi:sporulation protein YlmC with PRC-barrel domain